MMLAERSQLTHSPLSVRDVPHANSYTDALPQSDLFADEGSATLVKLKFVNVTELSHISWIIILHIINNISPKYREATVSIDKRTV